MKPKPSDRIYELATKYDDEQGSESIMPSPAAVIWGLVKFLDEQWEAQNKDKQ